MVIMNMEAQAKKKSNKDKWEGLRVKLSYLKDSVDPRYLVESLGFEILRETSKELRAMCMIHGGDNPTSFRFNKDRKTWVCFSHKCHEVHGNDIIGLIKATQGLDFMSAVDYLSKLTGDVESVYKILEYKKEKERREFMDYNNTEEYIHQDVSEERLMRYRRHRPKFFCNEGFSSETLDYFEVAGGYKTKHDRLIRDIIPIRTTEGKLVAYSARDIRPDADYESKYWITPGLDKDKVLYNLNNIIPVDHTLIIVEGFKSVWRLYDYGIKNVVAAIGSKLTQGQRNLLCSHALHGAVILFDNDEAGVLGTVDAYENLKDKLDVYPIFITEVDENDKGLDPADLDKDTVYDYLAPYI